MISVSFKKRNFCEQSAIAEGLQVAVEHFADLCKIDRIGYEFRCEKCYYKQGCRDLYRAASFSSEKYILGVNDYMEMEEVFNEDY